MDFTSALVASQQERLAELGFYTLRIDGDPGSGTMNAFADFKAANGLRQRPFPGPVTCDLLWSDEAKSRPITPFIPQDETSLPWLVEARRLLGTKEVKGKASNPKIMQWAKDLDQWYPGDDVPWCGLFTAHCLNIGAPEVEQNFNRLGARNWLNWGEEASLNEIPLGGVAVFWRTARDHWHGHVAPAITAVNDTHVCVIGGNQSDNVTEAWFRRDRLLGVRLPPNHTPTPAPVRPTGSLSKREN